MAAEDHRAGLGRAVGIEHHRLRQQLVDLLEQARADRRRAHAQKRHRGQVGAGQRLALAQHHGHHRRHGRQPGAAVARDRVDVAQAAELRHQHDGGARGDGQLAQAERVHVIQRGRDQEAVARHVLRAAPRLDDPQVALVRQHHALGSPGRTRGIEEHRRLVGRRQHRLEGPGVEEVGKGRGARRQHLRRRAEDHRRHPGRAGRQAFGVAEEQARACVADHEVAEFAREAMVHRHRHEARLHRAQVGHQVFAAVGRQDGNALAALQPLAAQGPCRRADGRGKLGVAQLLRTAFAAQVNQGQPVCRRGRVDQVAEIAQGLHRVL